MNQSHPPPSIAVAAGNEPGTYTVEVRTQTVTQHRVSISPAYLRELGVGTFPPTRVLHEAFLFLLEREPNTSVLSKFDLRDIERYFPEFRADIVQRLRG